MENLPFPMTKKFYHVIEMIIKKIRVYKEDGCGIICGPKRSGKSLVAQKILYIAQGQQKDLSLIPFTVDELFRSVYTHSETVIIADEAIKSFFSGNVNTKRGKQVTQFWQEMGAQNNFLLLLCPSPLQIARDIREEASFIIEVSYSHERREGLIVNIKGNMKLYVKWPNDNQVLKYLNWRENMRGSKGEYFKAPLPYCQTGGEAFIKGKKEGYYSVPKEMYLAKKHGALKEFHISEHPKERKEPNMDIDFKLAARMIKEKYKLADIARTVNASLNSIKNLSRTLKHKNNG